MSYYTNQLLKLEPDDVYYQSIILFDGKGNKTFQLDLNIESIPVLIDFLMNEQKRLELIKQKGI